MSNLIEGISEEIGFPFGIRGTARQYYKESGALPSGDSDYEGLSFGGEPRLHFFVVDQKAVESFPKKDLDLILKRSVIKSVSEYSVSHSSGMDWELIKGFEESAMPVLYLFYAGQNYGRDRYKDAFSKLNGKPTFPEADSSKDKSIHPKGIFCIGREDYDCLDPKARTFANILTPTIRVDNETGMAYFKDQNFDSVYRFFEAMYGYQKSLGQAVPRGYRFRMPSKKEVARLMLDEERFLASFNKAYLMNFVANHYRESLYRKFAEKLFSDVEKEFS